MFCCFDFVVALFLLICFCCFVYKFVFVWCICCCFVYLFIYFGGGGGVEWDVYFVLFLLCLFGWWLLSFLFVRLMILSPSFFFFCIGFTSMCHLRGTDDVASVSCRPVSFHLHGLRCGGGGSWLNMFTRLKVSSQQSHSLKPRPNNHSLKSRPNNHTAWSLVPTITQLKASSQQSQLEASSQQSQLKAPSQQSQLKASSQQSHSLKSRPNNHTA